MILAKILFKRYVLVNSLGYFTSRFDFSKQILFKSEARNKIYFLSISFYIQVHLTVPSVLLAAPIYIKFKFQEKDVLPNYNIPSCMEILVLFGSCAQVRQAFESIIFNIFVENFILLYRTLLSFLKYLTLPGRRIEFSRYWMCFILKLKKTMVRF